MLNFITTGFVLLRLMLMTMMMTGQNLEVLRCDDEMILSILLAMFYICSSLIKYYLYID